MSLIGQTFAAWFDDQRRWLDALLAAWTNDTAHGPANRTVLAAATRRWLPEARRAVSAVARAADAVVPTGAAAAIDELADAVGRQLAAAGVGEGAQR